jgi:phosphoribosyl-AMP cyclohydrolase/catechol 2,3-dioxygenase-like lactoylglutathione lyase family enzyme
MSGDASTVGPAGPVVVAAGLAAEAVAWGEGGLVAGVVQDVADGCVLMVGWLDAEALAATLATGEVHFHSRSRGRLWRKGESSGNVLRLRTLAIDCDGDALLLGVEPVGPTCHREVRSCFDGDGAPATRASQGFAWLESLWATIAWRAADRPAGSYTTSPAARWPRRRPRCSSLPRTTRPPSARAPTAPRRSVCSLARPPTSPTMRLSCSQSGACPRPTSSRSCGIAMAAPEDAERSRPMSSSSAFAPHDRAKQVFAITLFVDDLEASERFYHAVFGMPLVHKDAESIAYRFPNLIVNVLLAGSAAELIEPVPVGPAGTPSRFVLTLQVDDVDAFAAHVQAVGVPILNGPVDRPWGPRTVTIADPSGHCWELSD